MYERLLELYHSDTIDDYRRHSLDHFFECETGKKYNKIISVCKEHGGRRIFDIGCAYGEQSECFINSNVEYVGVEEYKLDFWNEDKFKYIIGHYPFKIKTQEDDVAVSVLCLTWNCYLYEGEKTLNEQLQQLSDDFNKAILYIAQDKVEYVKKYFNYCEHIEGNIYYFEKTYKR